MDEHGMYFGKNELYNIIRSCGGTWNDSKKRPIICIMKSIECDGLYWAIPVGNYEHRDDKAKQRIQKYLNFDKKTFARVSIILGTQMKNLYFL